MSNLTTFVKETLPNFIRTDHPVFESFVVAYYEWLESTNTGTSTSKKDLWKELPNPVGIINNIEEYRDIDETLDQFIDFFAAEVVPTTLNGIKTDPKFFIKKLRDLYLAKGTIKSFELFFKIYFNEDIEVYQTRDSILKSSDGKYLTFPTAYFMVEEFSEYTDNIDFVFSVLKDLYGNENTILNGTIVDTHPLTNAQVIRVSFANNIDIDVKKNYTITDNNNRKYFIRVKPLLSIDNLIVTNGGSLFQKNDNLAIFESGSFSKKFIATASEVLGGKVDSIAIRNRGNLYKTGDIFKFESLENSIGQGGSIVITSVDSETAITSIDDVATKSGVRNNKYKSNSFQSAYLKVNSGGYWNKLPIVSYKPVISANRDINFDDSYLQSNGFGLGAQITPLSDSIGKVHNVYMNQSPYFLDSDDISLTILTNILVENQDSLREGDIVNFRTWEMGGGKRKYLFQFKNIIDANVDYDVYEYNGFYNQQDISNYNLDLVKSNLTLVTSIDGLDSEGTFENDSDSIEKKSVIGYSDDLSYGLDDSEELTFSAIVYSNVYVDANTGLEIEDNIEVNANLLINLDSENYNWQTIRYSLNPSLGVTDVWDNYVTDLDNSSLRNKYVITSGDFNTIDGGAGFGALLTGNIIDGLDLSSIPTEIIEGGNTYSYSKTVYKKIKVLFDDKLISYIEDKTFFDELNAYKVNTDKLTVDWNILRGNYLNNAATLKDAGYWENTSKYAKIKRIDGNVVQVVPYLDYSILTQKELDKLLSSKYNLVKIEPVYSDDITETIDEDYSPFQNIVHKITSASIDYKMRIVVNSDKQFWDESGYLSSSDKSVLQDNYYYSDYSYNITTTLPYIEWKNQFKKMLHPAGMIQTATAVFNLETSVNPNTNSSFNFNTIASNKATFDSMLEYGEDFTRLIFTEQFQINKDNIVHKIEDFNEANSELGLGYLISNGDYVFPPNIAYQQQKGDSFWDYEPLGWVSENSTQDSDSNGKVKEEIQYYSFDRINNQKSRYGINFPVIVQTRFIYQTDSDYDVLNDSNLPNDLFARFGDSDNSFKGIDYNRLKTSNDNKTYQPFLTNRKIEIEQLKEKDLHLAMMEDNKLVYSTKDGTYYDYDAYELKWNSNNPRRFIHESGWYDHAYIPYYLSKTPKVSDSLRRTSKLDYSNMKVLEKISPLNKTIFDDGDYSYKNSYYNSEINTLTDSNITSNYLDPSISMKGRKG